MNLFAIIGVALIGAILTLLFRQYKPEYALLISLGCGILLFFLILDSLATIFEELSAMMERLALPTEYAAAMIKALGICYVVNLAADTCRDAGESALASKVELCGKVAVVLIALPLFEQLLSVALNLIAGSV